MPDTLEKIAESIRTGAVDRAEKLLAATTETTDNAARVTFLRGMLHERRFDVAAAIEAYESTLEMEPDHREARFRAAILRDLRGDDEAAIEHYEACIDAPEVPAHLLINLSLLYEENKRYREAERCLDAVLEADPNHRRARLFRKHLASTINMVYDDEAGDRNRQADTLLETPVTEFELSVRSRNCLKQMDIHTLGDLLRTTETDLLEYKNFGETSLNEIRALLNQKGMHVGQLLEEPQVDPLARPTPPPVAGDPAVLGRPVSELELSVRSRRCLQRLGITSLEELISRSETELLSIKNFGLTSLTEIKRELNERGLFLRGSHA